MHFDVVLSEFSHPCSKKRRRAQFSIRAELTWLSVCIRFRCVRVSASDCSANNSEGLLCSPRAFGQSLYQVLVREIERDCTHWL